MSERQKTELGKSIGKAIGLTLSNNLAIKAANAAIRKMREFELEIETEKARQIHNV